MMKKFIMLPFLLLICNSISAQGWVTDEASKDNSGGVFSGIFGLLLLFGLIWFIGHVMDIISEDREIRERRKSRQKKEIAHTPILKKQENHDAELKCNDNQKSEQTDVESHPFDGKTFLHEDAVIPSAEDLTFIEKEKVACRLSVVRQDDWDNAIIDWGERENDEHESSERGEALYSYDGKKLLDEYKADEFRIKDGVEIICDGALLNISNDDNIVFPSTIKILGNKLFYYNYRERFIIPQSVEIITGNPFATCKGYIDCLSPDFVFEDGILYDKEKKKIISVMWDYHDVEEDDRQINPHVIMIGRFSFFGIFLDRKRPLVIPPSVLYIGESAFEECHFQISLSNGTIEIGISAFAKSSVSTFALPPSVSKLGGSSFWNCKFLETILLSPNIEAIEGSTFQGCNKLNHVNIPSGIKVLKRSCFKNCTSLSDIIFPKTLERIEVDAFAGCPLNRVVLYKKTIVDQGAFPCDCEIIFRD